MSHRSKYRTYIKQVDHYLAQGDLESATQAYKEAVPIIDSMVNRGLIHKNNAARHKSRLNSKLKVLSNTE